MSTVADVPRASDRAYATLLHEIQTGELAPGTVIAEPEQSARLGISRTPVREALQRLATEGLLVQNSPRITTVAPIDFGDIRSLFELRRALEDTAARAAAQRGDTAEFSQLADAFAAVAAAERIEPDAYYRLIARFDQAIDEAAANSYLSAALRTVRTHLVRVRRLARDKPARLQASVSEHQLIARAIADGNAELAANAVHVHLHNALSSIEDSLAARDLINPKPVEKR